MKTDIIETFIRESWMHTENNPHHSQPCGTSDISTIKWLAFMKDMEFACMRILPPYRVQEWKRHTKNDTNTFFE